MIIFEEYILSKRPTLFGKKSIIIDNRFLMIWINCVDYSVTNIYCMKLFGKLIFRIIHVNNNWFKSYNKIHWFYNGLCSKIQVRIFKFELIPITKAKYNPYKST